MAKNEKHLHLSRNTKLSMNNCEEGINFYSVMLLKRKAVFFKE